MSFLSSLFGFGGSKPATQQTIQATRLPEEVAPFAKDVLGDAQKLYEAQMAKGYTPYLDPTIAPMTEEQLQAQEGLKGLVGTSRPLQEEALGMYRAGADRFTDLSPEQMESYMSPYQRAVTDIEKREAQKVFESQIMPKFEKQAVSAGGMSGMGSRAGVQAAQLGQAQMQQMGDIESRGLQSAYQDARNLFKQQQQAQRVAAGDIAGLAPTRQQALDEAYYRYLEEQSYPQEQLAGYSGFVYGNPLMQQRDVTTTKPAARGASAGSQLLGLGMTAAKMYGMGGGSAFGGSGFTMGNLGKAMFTKTGGRLSGRTGGGLSSLPVVYKQIGGGLDEGAATSFSALLEEERSEVPPLSRVDSIIRSLGATSATPSEEDVQRDARLTREALEEATTTERQRRLAASELRKETQLGMLKKPSFDLTAAIAEAGRGYKAGDPEESAVSALLRILGPGLKGYDIQKAAIAKKKAELEGKRGQEEELTEQSNYKENLALLEKDEKLRDLVRGLPQKEIDSILKNATSRADIYAKFAKAKKDLSGKGTGKAFSKPLDQLIDSVYKDNDWIFDSSGNYVGGSKEVLEQGSHAQVKLRAEVEAARQAYISYLDKHGSDYSDQVKAQAAARKAINETRKRMRRIRDYFKFPIGNNIPKDQLKKDQTYRIGPLDNPSLWKWNGEAWDKSK